MAPPELSLSAKRKQRLGKPVKVKVACDEACTVVAEGKVKPKGKRPLPKAAKLRRKQVKLENGERQTLKLKLSKSAARKLKRGAERAVAKVDVNATDAAGNVAKAKRKVKLR